MIELSKKLPDISDTQVQYARQNCFEHVAKRTKSGVITCLDCGHSWQSKQTLIDSVCGMICPNCKKKLKICDTRKFCFADRQYFCIITTGGGFQVLRFFHIDYHVKAGEKAHYFHSETVQRWIAPDGKNANVARLRPGGYYGDRWNHYSALEIRSLQMYHNIRPVCFYPRVKLIPELQRSGFNGDFHQLSPCDMFLTLLSDSRAETLLKAKQIDLLKFFAVRNFDRITDFWPSVKICIRNGYTVSDASNWVDYVNLLRFFGKDLHSATYVCPADLTAEHDRYVRKKRELQERERREQARVKALENELLFHEMKSRFFGLQFSDGVIQVRMLESVAEIVLEGDMMCHCIFTNEYHLKPDSLILSACVDGQKVETVEFSLSKMEVIQCRGKYNQTTEYHSSIIELINRNIREIKKRMAA